MSTPAKVFPLRQLVNVLSDAVARIEEKYASANLDFPPLDRPFDEKDPASLLLSDPDVVPFSSVILTATDQLVVSARHPMQAVLDMAQSHAIPACLRLVCEANVVEILREAGPEGLHVKGIAAKNKLHSGKLGRALRLLATHHVFREISPDVFANNSLSSVLDSGKSVEALFTQPRADKFKGVGASQCALVEMSTDDAMMASTTITDALLDPKTSHSEESSDAPCLRVFKTKSFFEYLMSPENEYRGARLHAAMSANESPTVVPGGFPWETLPEGTKIVDVGGGVGSACLDIMRKHPHFKFVVQDLPHATEQAIAYWKGHEPEAIAGGRVTIQAHDFFTTQLVHDADVFLLRSVLHDWSNAKSIEILERLREVAIPGKTKVVIVDTVIQYACPVDHKKIPGAEDIVFEGMDEKSKVPTGLLPNLGRAEARNYYVDLGMMALNNGQERTLGDHILVTEVSGWKIKKIYSPEGRRISHILAVAV